MCDNYKEPNAFTDAEILRNAAHFISRYESDLKLCLYDHQRHDLRNLINYKMKQVIETALLYIK